MLNETEQLVEERQVRIPYNGISLEADLSLPANAIGIVLLPMAAAAAGSARGTRVRREHPAGASFATLLLDLLTLEEERAEAGPDTSASTSENAVAPSRRCNQIG